MKITITELVQKYFDHKVTSSQRKQIRAKAKALLEQASPDPEELDDWPEFSHTRLPMASIEEITPVNLKDMPDSEIINLHHRLHQIWGQHFKNTTKERAGQLVREDIWNAHKMITEEMKRRGIHHDSPLPQRSQQAEVQLPDEITVVPQFVSIVGSTAKDGPGQSDVDVLIRAQRIDGKFIIHGDNIDLPVRKVLDPEKSGYLHFIANPQGPHAEAIPLYDLVLRNTTKITTIQLGTISPIKIDLGCGSNKPQGYIGVDKYAFPDTDIIFDLEDGLPFPSNYADEIRAHHVLEHLSNPIHIMTEIWRVLKPDGLLMATVPSTRGEGAFAHPDHKSFWNKVSFVFYSDPELIAEIGFTGRFSIEAIDEEAVPDSIYVHARLRAIKPSQNRSQLAIQPFYTGPLPKPAMKFHTEFFNVDELWDKWARKRIDNGIMIEEKLNGFRALLQKRGDQIRLTLMDEDRTDHAQKFPEIVKAAKEISGDFIMDGDLGVVQNNKRWPRPKLMQLIADSPKLPENAKVVFTAFDLLYADKDLTDQPLETRRQKLLDLTRGSQIHVSKGKAVFNRTELEKAARELANQNMSEGIVAKELRSPYPLKRATNSWAKIKHVTEIKAIVLSTRRNPQGTYNFRGGVLPSDDRFPNRKELNGVEYIDLGFSFNAPFKANPGDIVTFQVQEIILEPNGELAWLGAKPLDIDKDRKAPYTATQIIDLAKRSNILQDARTQNAIQEEGETRAERAAKFWEENWFKSFPKSGKDDFVYQHHWRGLSEEEAQAPETELFNSENSVHGDLRCSFGPALWGFTCFLGQPSDAQKRDLPNLPHNDALQGKFKLHQPKAWLTVAREKDFIAPPGGVGSTSRAYSKFIEIDHGTYEIGVWHKHFFEIFLKGSKVKGRYLIQFAQAPDGRRFWQIAKPKDQTPFARKHDRDKIIAERRAKGDQYLIWSEPGKKPELINLKGQ